MALGLGLGLMIGILPKDNLLFVGLLVILIVSGASLLTGALAGLVGSLLSATLQPLAHSLGQRILSPEYLLGPISEFMQLPVVPWMRLDNTLVTGSLFLGVVAFVPIYLCSVVLLNKHYEHLQTMFQQNSLFNRAFSQTVDEGP